MQSTTPALKYNSAEHNGILHSRTARCSLDIVQGRKMTTKRPSVLSLHPKIHSGDMSCLCRLRRQHNALWLTMFELPCIQICSNMLKSFKHTALWENFLQLKTASMIIFYVCFRDWSKFYQLVFENSHQIICYCCYLCLGIHAHSNGKMG